MSLKERVLICGGRNFDDFNYMGKVLDACKPYVIHSFIVIHGGASGADTMAGMWAEANGVPQLVMRAYWGYFKKKAGHIRNHWMLDYAKPDLVIAFPGGDGTANMIKIAREAGIDVYEVPPNAD